MIRTLPLLVLAIAPPVAAQTQNKAETGSGGVLETMESIQGEYAELWAGRPGQVVKGVVGVAAIARALGAARDALTFEGAVNQELQPTPGGGSTNSGSPSTSTGTTTSTSTN